jgi:hypothetical protein
MSEQIFNSYDEAHKYSLTVPWKLETCNVGETCWCRVIVPSESIKFKEKISNWILEDITRDFDCIIPDGSVDKETAEYIVELHNRSVAIYAGQKERLAILKELNRLDQELRIEIPVIKRKEID